jgi:hypothetical protein
MLFLFHVKTCIVETVSYIDLQIDNLFPNIGRLICKKEIKDNVSVHLKNKIGCKNIENIIIISNIFGSNGFFFKPYLK